MYVDNSPVSCSPFAMTKGLKRWPSTNSRQMTAGEVRSIFVEFSSPEEDLKGRFLHRRQEILALSKPTHAAWNMWKSLQWLDTGCGTVHTHNIPDEYFSILQKIRHFSSVRGHAWVSHVSFKVICCFEARQVTPPLHLHADLRDCSNWHQCVLIREDVRLYGLRKHSCNIILRDSRWWCKNVDAYACLSRCMSDVRHDTIKLWTHLKLDCKCRRSSCLMNLCELL